MDIWVLIGTSVITSVLTLGGLILYMKRTIPNLLVNVTEIMGNSIGGILEKPMTKRAMSILGKTSGESRRGAVEAREFKEAEGQIAKSILANSAPEIQLVLDRIAPNLIEDYGADVVLNLAVKYAPMLQQFLNPKGLPFTKKQKSGFGEI